ELARLLLIELLSWQFASPVRWIETQELLFGKVDQIIEVGLASSPTLTNLATRSLAVAGIPEGTIRVLNVERDQEQVMLADVSEAPAAAPAAESDAEEAPQASEAPTETPAEAAPTAPTPAPTAATASDAPELRFGAAEAIMVLFAFQNKIRVDQIADSDTVEELTNGVSSRRNQLLMDMSAEIGVPAIDGAADADVATLREKVATAAPGYSAFGPVLGEAVGARLRQLFGAAGLKPTAVADYVTGTWGLPESWVSHVEAEILLGSREEDSVRGGSLSTVPASATSKSAAHELIDAAVQAVAATHGASVSKGAAAGGAGGGAVVDSAALDAFAETVTGENGVLATVARQVLSQLGLGPEPELIEAPDTTVIDAVEAELGSGWLKSVTPSFDANKAVLFDDSWAIARERLARLALSQAEYPVDSFRGAGEDLARQARWWKRGDIAQAAVDTTPGAFAGEVALVTGAAPGSIATALVERLLEGGATVIMTASRVSQARKEFARTLYAEHGAAGSALWLVPANLSSFRDIDALIDWIGTSWPTRSWIPVGMTASSISSTASKPA
ncbi:type I polyketide synthase, partial [Corynebacterium hesseae]